MDASDLEGTLDSVDKLLIVHAPYHEIVAALDECARLPGADTVGPGIWQRRLNALHLYNRPDEERARVIDEYLTREEPLAWRASSVGAVCADRPELARRYLLPIIDELEAVSGTDRVLDRILTSLRIARDRTLGHQP